MKKITVFLMAGLLMGTNVQAATFCVSNSTMLETVLDITESNGQSDVIKIQSGNYIPLNSYGFRFYLGENHGLDISGSWSSGCAEQSMNPLDTILDGDNSNRVISFYTDQNSPEITASISLSVMSVNNGLHHEQSTVGYNTSGLGFRLSFAHEGSITVDRLFFMNNRSNRASAIRGDGAKLTIKNSVFFNNESDSGTVSTVAKKFYFINNTMVNNTYYDQFNGGTSNAGLFISSFTEQAFVANNIIWDNYGPDVLALSTPEVYLYNNDYQSVSGTFDYMSGNISEDPQLEFFAPPITSPVVDKGKSKPSGIIPFPPPFYLNWNYGDYDFLNLDRVVNNRVDIGAIEALPEEPIFKNGFEQTRGG
ncbi:MAG: hypothetical protein R3E90_07290 [Marinicella sp.]